MNKTLLNNMAKGLAALAAMFIFAMSMVSVVFAAEANMAAAETPIAGSSAPVQAQAGNAQQAMYVPQYLPDIFSKEDTPGALITKIYNYSIGIMGIIALGALTYAGIMYVVSAGNPAKLTDAKSRIYAVIWGIVLLIGTRIIFDTINPNIVDINKINEKLKPKTIEIKKETPWWQKLGNVFKESTSTSAMSQQEAINLYGGAPGFADLAAKIKPCNDCTSTFAGGATFPVKSGACVGNCQINKDLLGTLNNLKTIGDASGISWRMTEGYPPTVNHQSSCHFDGTCVDIGLIGGASAAQVNAFINAAQAAGLTVVNEYPVGSNSQHFETTTGGHLHVRR